MVCSDLEIAEARSASRYTTFSAYTVSCLPLLGWLTSATSRSHRFTYTLMILDASPSLQQTGLGSGSHKGTNRSNCWTGCIILGLLGGRTDCPTCACALHFFVQVFGWIHRSTERVITVPYHIVVEWRRKFAKEKVHRGG